MKKNNVKKLWQKVLGKITQQGRELLDEAKGVFLKRQLIKIPVQRNTRKRWHD